ncbi:hypothetical protein ONZ45_g11172 [Pleurotus djamor]|nr:hypothetical protein ONZ45_g11172 [Pleurotus djamor]
MRSQEFSSRNDSTTHWKRAFFNHPSTAQTYRARWETPMSQLHPLRNYASTADEALDNDFTQDTPPSSDTSPPTPVGPTTSNSASTTNKGWIPLSHRALALHPDVAATRA